MSDARSSGSGSGSGCGAAFAFAFAFVFVSAFAGGCAAHGDTLALTPATRAQTRAAPVAAAPPARAPEGASTVASTSALAAAPATEREPAPAPESAPESGPPPLTRPELAELAARFALPEPALAERRPLALWATHYYVPEVHPDPRGFPLRDMSGAPLGPRLSRRDFCFAALEGSVRVFDSASGGGGFVTYNYAGTARGHAVDCRPIYRSFRAGGRARFERATGPFGDGVNDLVLVPFRSVAVDPKVVPFGSLLYIPAARGTRITLPSGAAVTHDGYFLAADRGGGIKKNHIDVFVGVLTESPFGFVTSRRQPTFDAYVLGAQGDVQAVLAAAHGE